LTEWDKKDAQRARAHSKAFTEGLKPKIEAMFFAAGIVGKAGGKRAVRGRFLGSNRAKRPDFEAKNRGFPVIFRGQISRCGMDNFTTY
jgi:hypothetical protein